MPKSRSQAACVARKCYSSKNVGVSRCHCSTCHEFFNSDKAFDKHRVGDFGSDTDPRRCMTVEEMSGAGMEINKDGYWITEAYIEKRKP